MALQVEWEHVNGCRDRQHHGGIGDCARRGCAGSTIVISNDTIVAAVLAGTVGVAGGTARLAFDAHVQDEWQPEARGPGYARYETLLQLGWVIGAAPASLIGLNLHVGSAVVAATAGVGWW